MNKSSTSNKNLKELYKAIIKIDNTNDCKKFMRDLCTQSELDAMSERLVVAKMVDNKISYRNISSKTGSSTATVTRVAHWLHHGMGGYKLILDRLKS